MEHLSNDHTDHPNPSENNHKLYDEKEHSSDEKPIETARTTWSDFLMRGKATVEQILGSAEISKPKDQDC